MDNAYENQTDALRDAAGISIGYLDPRDLDGMVMTAGIKSHLARANITSDLPVYGKQDYAELKISQLAAHLKGLKDHHAELKDHLSNLKDEIEYLSDNILPDRMEDEDIETLRIKNVGRLQSSSDIRCSVLAANREDLQEWLRTNGFDSMVKPDVNSSTLKAFIKDCIREGNPYPSDLVNVSPYVRATVVKA